MNTVHSTDLGVFVSGVELVTERLVDVLDRPNARVRILTGDYQDVSDPLAMRRLLQLVEHADVHPSAQFELRVYEVDPRREDSFHPKAWIVGYAERTHTWVGSSNLSRRALVTGLEWN
jgi:HKD family nuclease